jgi:Na+-translocating ferredoxin:NAD+ oxidoreductase subunit G
MILGLVVVAAVLAVALSLINVATRERIERNEQAWITQRLDALVPPNTYDNDPLTDRISVVAPDLLGSSYPVTIYRARRNGKPVAAILRPVAPDGYRGPIELLVAIAHDGTLIGVQVIAHKETPGLGDAFERRQPQWLGSFSRRSLSDPPQNRWTVRKDGGDFDQFTGATITPRAIVKQVRRTLEYYAANEERVFATSE